VHEFKVKTLLMIANTDDINRKLLIAQYLAEFDVDSNLDMYTEFENFEELKNDIEMYVDHLTDNKLIKLIHHYIKLSETVSEYDKLEKS
jgi:hypothetical protein